MTSLAYSLGCTHRDATVDVVSVCGCLLGTGETVGSMESASRVPVQLFPVVMYGR